LLPLYFYFFSKIQTSIIDLSTVLEVTEEPPLKITMPDYHAAIKRGRVHNDTEIELIL
jgi:hypothetical protein